MCWGLNQGGAAGGGATSSTVSIPTQINITDGTTPLDGVVEVLAGSGTFCARVDNGTVWCWGSNSSAVHYNAANYGVTNVVSLGSADPRFLTNDGVYHNNTTAITPKCGSLQ